MNEGYEEKFKNLIQFIDAHKGKDEPELRHLGVVLVVTHPAALGDDYEELVESLGRIAEAGIALRIEGRAA